MALGFKEGQSTFQPPKVRLSKNALTVLEKRYLRKGPDGRPIETPEQMFWRVARCVASADLIYDPEANVDALAEQFYTMMADLDFLPNSPTLMNAGTELQQLSACFVLPLADSMESIFSTLKDTAMIHKSGGGTGFSFSRIRPENDRVLSTGGVASGPVSFIKVFDAATDAVKQGGTRRGANMAILNVDHPDILAFITAKRDHQAINNFNLSVGITEDFMRAVEEDAEYPLVSPRTGEEVGRLRAAEVLDLIVECAWASGEPGIVFLDRINRDNPTPALGPIESTNPCGEQPLLPYESCNLGSINLSHVVASDGGRPVVDWEHLAKLVHLAVRFLDNVIDVNQYPLKAIEERTKSNRKIGLGVMGFADMLIQLEVPYNSAEGLRVGEEVMRFVREQARDASRERAKDRGTFPSFSDSIYARMQMPLRNATLTTVAPTGTLSIIAGCASGIEPNFALSYVRNILDGQRLVEVHPLFEAAARREGFYSNSLMEAVAEHGTVKGMEGIPAHVQKVFVTAHDISPEWHVRMQAAFQRHVDNAVSKTVNFAREATREDVRRAFILAYREGCKGITIYRDGSRDKQVLSTKASSGDGKVANRAEGSQPDAEGALVPITPRARPEVTTGVTQKVATGCGNLYVTVNSDEKGFCEVFAAMGKAGGCASAQSEAISRLISLALRSGVDVESITKQLSGIRCPSTAWHGGRIILSCPDAIGRVMEARLRNGTTLMQDHKGPQVVRNLGGQCPECSSLLEYADGCFVCRSCGYSKCG